MREKLLLLPSARTLVLVESSRARAWRYAYWALLAVGLLCVLIGAADVSTRLVQDSLGEETTLVAFGPAAALQINTAPAASTPGTVVPVRLRIPSLGVDAAVEQVGIKADGTMGTPQDFRNVAWYSLGGKPGAAGSAVFAGHVNNGLTNSGVFSHLSKVKKGDYITVADETGRTKVYQVSTVTEYAADAPTESLFAATGASQLVLITCDGDWIPSARTFDKRLVVVAKPAY